MSEPVTVQGVDPRTGAPVGTPIPVTTPEALDAAVVAAARAFPTWSALPASARAAALRAVADALEDARADLVALADAETGLGVTRLTGEVGRTTGQLRMFAARIEDGGHLEVIVSRASGDAGRPDLRRMLQPRGPVAVFSASNFPFAFSVAGGDTASALAAGCPVVVKAHEAHPATSSATAVIVEGALARSDAPAGTFGIVYGPAAGGPLVAHPAITAVGFTGSLRGGAALQAIAAGRAEPIPFYGELGSTNPSVVLPTAATERAEQTATGFAASLTQGVGQFCTKPGLLFAPTGSPVCERIAEVVAASGGGPLLTARIKDEFESFDAWDGLPVLAAGAPSADAFGVAPELRGVGIDDFAARLDDLAVERFGPAGLLVAYDDVEQLLPVLSRLPGSLAASVHAAPADEADTLRVAAALRHRVGRLIMNGWPTGVAVCAAQHHGGPWPATTDARHTSVGATALQRWLVPIVYQDWPEDLLPPELRSSNPLGIDREVED